MRLKLKETNTKLSSLQTIVRSSVMYVLTDLKVNFVTWAAFQQLFSSNPQLLINIVKSWYTAAATNATFTRKLFLVIIKG